MNLEEVRKEIDEIDSGLTTLIVRRMEASKAVAQAKIESGLPIFNAEREKIVVENAAKRSGEYADVARNVFASLMDMSKALQYKLIEAEKENNYESTMKNAGREIPTCTKIACQGAKGAYSHCAANHFFPDAEPVFYNSFDEVISAVESGQEQFRGSAH